MGSLAGCRGWGEVSGWCGLDCGGGREARSTSSCMASNAVTSLLGAVLLLGARGNDGLYGLGRPGPGLAGDGWRQGGMVGERALRREREMGKKRQGTDGGCWRLGGGLATRYAIASDLLVRGREMDVAAGLRKNDPCPYGGRPHKLRRRWRLARLPVGGC